MRVRLGLAGLAVLVMTGCSALGNDGDKAAPDVRVDHSTTASAAAPLPDTGPAPGALAESWHIDTPLGQSPAGLTPVMSDRLVDGQLLVASAAGLDVYDAHTGRPRWHYHEPGRTLAGYALTAGTLVALTGKRDGPGADRWVGLDSGTGRIRWTSGDKGFGFHQGGLELLGGAGTVPVMRLTRSGNDDLLGIDARTGRTRWDRRAAEHGCKASALDQAGAGRSDGSLLMVSETCGRRYRTLALDPASGRTRWARDLSSQPNMGTVTVRGGVVLIADDNGPTSWPPTATNSSVPTALTDATSFAISR